MKISPSGSGRSAIALLVILGLLAPQARSVSTLRGKNLLQGNTTDFATILTVPSIDTGFTAPDDSTDLTSILALPDPAADVAPPLPLALPQQAGGDAQARAEGKQKLQDLVSQLSTIQQAAQDVGDPSSAASLAAPSSIANPSGLDSRNVPVDSPGAPADSLSAPDGASLLQALQAPLDVAALQGGSGSPSAQAAPDAGGGVSAAREFQEPSDDLQNMVSALQQAPQEAPREAADISVAPSPPPSAGKPAATAKSPATPAAAALNASEKSDNAAEEEEQAQERADAEAVARLQSRLNAQHRNAKRLQHSLEEAVKQDHTLEDQLSQAKGVVSSQKSKLKVLSKKAKSVATALSEEWKTERDLQWKLNNATAKLNEEVHMLSNMRKELESTNRTLEQEREAQRAAQAAQKRTMAEVHQHEKALKAAKREATRQKHRANVAEAGAAKLQRRVDKDEQEIRKQKREAATSSEALEKKVAALEAQLAQARADKHQEEAALNTSLAEGRTLKGQVAHALSQERRLKQLVEQERAEAQQRQAVLSKELGMDRQAEESEKAWEEELRQKTAKLRSSSEHQVHNLTADLREARAHESHLKKEKITLEHELAKDVRQKRALQKEVTKLKEKVEDGDRAQRLAESKTEEVAKELAQAQAVSKQLEGTVPQLLEQARLAHEARDAENAMRSQAQAAIVHMQKQYSKALTSQMNELAPAVPADTMKAQDNKPAEDMATSLEGDLGEVLTMAPSNSDDIAAVPLPDEDSLAKDVNKQTAGAVEPFADKADDAEETGGLDSLLSTPAGI